MCWMFFWRFPAVLAVGDASVEMRFKHSFLYRHIMTYHDLSICLSSSLCVLYVTFTTDIYLHADSTTEELISHYYWLLVVKMVEYLMIIPQTCSTSPNEARVKGIWSFGWPCEGVLHIRWVIIRFCIVPTIIPENKSIGSHIYRHVYAYTSTYEYTYTCTVTCT